MRALALALGLTLIAAAGAEDLTYEKIAQDPKPYKGKVVTFVFKFTNVQGSVNALLGGRGINNSNHHQVSNLFRGSLVLLVKRKKTAAVTALRGFERGQKVWITGEVERLSADNGAVFYFIDISGARPYETKKTKPKQKPTNAKPELTGGSKSKYKPLTIKELLKDPLSYHGKKVELTAAYLGMMKQVPAGAIELVGGKASQYKAVRLGRATGLVRLRNKRTLEILDGLTPLLNKVKYRGTLRIKKAGFGYETAMLIDEVVPTK